MIDRLLALSLSLALSSFALSFGCAAQAADNSDPGYVRCSGNDDDAINGAIADAVREHRGLIHLEGYCRMNGALAPPYVPGSLPVQQPVTLMGEGAAWNGYWKEAENASTVLDLRYDGKDGAHPAKIDTRGAGHLEITGLTLKSGGTDDLPFIQTTNTTVYIHDNAVIGNAAHKGLECAQDFLLLGSTGYVAHNVNMKRGSRTISVSIDGPRFTPKMVGWKIAIRKGSPLANDLLTTIAAYVSPTQVNLRDPAPGDITDAIAQWYGLGDDAHAPFQGYGSVIARNFYSHIRHGVVWGAYANGITVEDETYSNLSGAPGLHGAPYLFLDTPEGTVGNNIRGGTVEMSYYANLIDVEGNSPGNAFIGLGGYDGGVVGGVYFADSTMASHNSIVPGWFDPASPYVQTR
ncbi:MAG TPA: hypothetical protein VGZ00_02535 [Candidatus Baltobacteraceae bacterium]|jgi:hypothetical protein|nr:hypothetical protein [Candidatus Baltobacteraceae bacterium]